MAKVIAVRKVGRLKAPIPSGRFVAEDTVQCPKCGTKIPLSSVVTHTIEERLRRKLTSEVEEREQEVASREEKLKVSEKRVNERVEQLLREQLEGQTPKLRDRLRREILEERKGEMDELRNHLQAKDERLRAFEKKELDFVRKEEDFKDRERRLELDAKKAIDTERESLVEKVRGEESEKWEGQLRESQTELERVKQALDRAQKAGVSGELAGEAAERTLERRIRDAFPEDEVSSVGRGKQGGDLLQSVQGGGAILWESKDRYENWSNDWIPKLKRDRDDANASVGVLVTSVGPGSKSLRGPTYEDGVVLAPPGLAVGVGSLLRPMLGEIARQRRLYDKQETLQEAVYAWVTSAGFKNGIAAIAENLQTLKREVSRAKINHAKWFARLEVNVDRTARALGEFWGSAQGQARLPDIPVLALDEGDPPTEDSTDQSASDEL